MVRPVVLTQVFGVGLAGSYSPTGGMLPVTVAYCGTSPVVPVVPLLGNTVADILGDGGSSSGRTRNDLPLRVAVLPGRGRPAPRPEVEAAGGAPAMQEQQVTENAAVGHVPAQAWAEAEMAGARVPDRRILRSLSRIVAAVAAQPEVAFSAAVGHAGRQAARRICRREEVSVDDLLAGHVQKTAERCREYDYVLVPQDTTGMDFGTHRSTAGLGPTSNAPDSRGFFMHSALAVAPNGLPLGLLHANSWARDPEEYGKRETRHARDPEEKESYKWVSTLQAVEAAVSPQQRVVMLQDREADVFGFLSAPRRETTEVIVRAAQPRRVDVCVNERGDAWERKTLFEAAEGLAVAGTMTVIVPRKPGKSEREAQLEIRYTALYVLPGRWRRKGRPKDAPRYWVVTAMEAKPPEGEEPVAWVLLSSIPVTSFEEACRIVGFYTVRWLIERFHYTLKSGMKVERLQVDEAHALMKTVALHIPAAWRLLSLTYTARTDPGLPAAQVLSQEELAVLTQVEGKPVETVAQAVLAIAKLGGHEAYRGAKEPGVKRLWLGMRRLDGMVEGWRLARQAFAPAISTGALLVT